MIIVTGHKGFIGRHLVRELHAIGEEVIGFDLEDGQDICRDDLPKGASKVFHLAAQTNAQNADVFYDMRTNIIGTLRVLDQYGPKVVFASSVAIHTPTTPYAISKRAGEDYCRLMGAGIVRLCNIHGEGGHGVVDIFKRSEVLTIRGDGMQRRTYAPVEHAVEMLISCPPRALGILRGVNKTVLELANEHPGKPLEFVPASPNDIIDGVQPV